MNKQISRRSVLGGAAGLLALENGRSAAGMLTRVLGQTGVRIPVIAMGCGESWWRFSQEESKAIEALSLALDLGFTYFDTGQTYGRGISETWIGKAIKGRRDGLFLATKISVRDPDEAWRETERSLERLQTSRIDLIHIHNLQHEPDLAAIEKKGGLVDVLYKLRDQKIARFIGITSHLNPSTLKAAIERHDFDCVQMALNAAMQGHYEGATSRPGHSFESVVLPVARKKNMGILAMKSTARNALVGGGPDQASARDLIRYVLSLQTSAAVVGMGDQAHIRENAELARSFAPMPKSEMVRFSARISKAHKAALDRHYAHHVDG